MTHGHHALTDKEKETLRLLVNGYDAKSMARHLGLSVHTVNERLRDARRKMAVGSSREAARQLRDVEASTPMSPDPQSPPPKSPPPKLPTPKLLVDNVLGDALPDTDADTAPDQTESTGISRRAGWIIGGVTMSLALALFALTTLSGGADTAVPVAANAMTTENAPTTAAPATAEEAAAIEAGRQWLALLDTGDWDASYQATNQTFRSLNTVAVWADASRQVRTPLGAMRSRELATANYAPAPPNGYWVVRFDTGFANRAHAVETVSLAWEDGCWKVAGVTID